MPTPAGQDVARSLRQLRAMDLRRHRQARPTEPRLGKTTILIVDDETGSRESLRMILAPGHDVIAADCASEALDVLRTTHIDLVTVDLNMPGMKGDELMRIVRREFPDIEVVVITGCSSVETAVEGIRYGICDYLLKPFDVAQVNAAVGRALSRQKNRRRLLRFLEGIGAVLDKDEDTRSLLVELSRNVELQTRLRAAVQEPVLTPSPQRAKVSADRTLEFLGVLAETIESWNPALRGHSRRVTFYADLLAQRLGLGSQEREHVRISSLLHDLGKVGLTQGKGQSRQPEAKAKRTRPEQHPEIGERLVRPLAFSCAVASAIRHHHERWDGSGYPEGLRGQDIPLSSRIIALADFFDVMTSTHPDQARLSTTEAVEELQKRSGSRFDPHLVKEFISLLESGARYPEQDLPSPPAPRVAKNRTPIPALSHAGGVR